MHSRAHTTLTSLRDHPLVITRQRSESARRLVGGSAAAATAEATATAAATAPTELGVELAGGAALFAATGTRGAAAVAVAVSAEAATGAVAARAVAAGAVAAHARGRRGAVRLLQRRGHDLRGQAQVLTQVLDALVGQVPVERQCGEQLAQRALLLLRCFTTLHVRG